MAMIRISRCPPLAVAVPTPRNARPTCGRAMHFGSCPSPAPLRIQYAHPRNAFHFHSHCQKRATGQHPEPEPEPEQEAGSSENGGGSVFARKLLEFQKALDAAMGRRDAPDMFPREKEEISKYIVKISSSRADEFLNVSNKVMTCSEAQTALELASRIMDMADIEALGFTAEISHHTTHQMARKYAPIFCNVAEDAYHKRIKMDTIFSFLDALRGLGAVLHIVVQDTVAKVDDDPLKNSITCRAETCTLEFDKKINNLKDEFMMATDIEHSIVMGILFDGMKHTQSYVSQLIECRRDALWSLMFHSFMNPPMV